MMLLTKSALVGGEILSKMFRTIIVLFFFVSTISCAPAHEPDCVKISGEDIPDYPNAQNLVKDGPNKDWRETYRWDFTTSDSPQEVWKFYVDELGPTWHGEDHSNPQKPEENKLYLKKACNFVFFIVNSESIDSATYRITIQLDIEPGM